MKLIIKLFIIFFTFSSITYAFDSSKASNPYLLSPSGIIDNIKESMKYGSQRHKVIADNIARANIPKARAREMISLKKSFKASPKLKMYITSTNHIRNANQSSNYKTINDKAANVFTPNGNNIDLFQQSAKMEENTYNLKKSNKLYKQFSKLRKIAIGDHTE